MTTRVIAPTGNDSTGTGSLANPWRTLGKLYANLVAGDEGLVRGGTYTGADILTPVVHSAGSAGAPIVVHAMAGEVPVFDGTTSGTFAGLVQFNDDAAYHIVDGLQAQNFAPTSGGVIWIGADTAGHTADSITIRRCKITMKAGLTTNEHGIYLSYRGTNAVIEDNEIVCDNNPATNGAAIELFHNPAATNFLIQRNLVRQVAGGIQIWDDNPGAKTATGSILHNTVINCNNQFDLRFHAALTLKNNASDAVQNLGIFDPNNSGVTTSAGNFTGQTFNADYTLATGQSGRNGATDGLDAGAFQRGTRSNYRRLLVGSR